MKIRLIGITIVLSLINLCSTGQDFLVLNYENHDPVEGAKVLNLTNGAVCFSDNNGNVRIEGMGASDLFVVSSLGFQEKIYTAESLRKSNFIYIFPRVHQMDPVEVVYQFGKEENVRDQPNQIEIITKSEIRRKNAQTSADILQGSGTVLVQKSQMGGGSPVLRGFEANKVLLVLDGVRMNNAIYRSGHLQNSITIDNNILKQTEIIFGPGSVIYGSDALGGVIHYRTKDPRLTYKDSLQNKSVSFLGRMSSANQEQTYHIDASVGYKNFGFITSFTTSSFGDLRMGENRSHGDEEWGLIPVYAARIDGQDVALENSNPSIQKHTGYKQWDFLQKMVYSPREEVKLGLNFSYSTTTNVPRFDRYNDYLEDGTPRWAEWDYGPQNRMLLSLRADLTEEKRLYDEMHVVGAYQFITEDRIQRRFGRTTRETQSETVQVYSLNADFKKSLNKEATFNYGVELTYNDVVSEAQSLNIETDEIGEIATRYPDGGSDMQTMAAYFGWRKKLREKIKLNLGARYSRNILNATYLNNQFYNLPFDEISYNKGAFTGSIGTIFELDSTWQVNALFSSGYRAPNVDDVGKVREKDGFVTVPNDDVSPAYAYNGELSLKKKLLDERIQIEGTGYYTLLQNAIVNRLSTLNGQDSLEIGGEMARITTNVNASQAYIYGYHIALNASLTDYFLFRATYNYTEGWDQTEDVPLTHIPPVFGQVQLSYEKDQFSATINTMFNGAKDIDDYGPGSTDNPLETLPEGNPEWWTLNAYTSFYVSTNIELQFAVENILDQHYKQFASGISAPGRNFIFAARATF